jgi:small subunit ribosomal protein S13
MARIAGVEVPGNKQVWASLRYIYGIGTTMSYKILTQTAINPLTRTDNLTEEEVNRLREVIAKTFTVEGELKKEEAQNIRRLIEIGSYRGVRHRRSLPVRGQRTRTNARTRRGSRKTVAGRGQKRGATKT